MDVLTGKTLSVRTGTYKIGEQLALGSDTAVWYRGVIVSKRNLAVAIKVAHRTSVNPLLENERRLLGFLYSRARPESTRFIPVLESDFELPQPGGTVQVNVFRNPGQWFTLKQLMTLRLSDGIPLKQAVQVLRGLLNSLVYAHQKNVIHGAVLPTHIVVDRLDGDSPILVDWDYGVYSPSSTGERIEKIAYNEFFEWYPDWVFEDGGPAPTMDVLLGVQSVVYLLGGNPLSGEIPVKGDSDRGKYAAFQQAVETLLRPQRDGSLTATRALQILTPIVHQVLGV